MVKWVKMVASWNGGFLEWWLPGMVASWNGGFLEWWLPGMVASWNGGFLEWWLPGMMASWNGGFLVWWTTYLPQCGYRKNLDFEWRKSLSTFMQTRSEWTPLGKY